MFEKLILMIDATFNVKDDERFISMREKENNAFAIIGAAYDAKLITEAEASALENHTTIYTC